MNLSFEVLSSMVRRLTLFLWKVNGADRLLYPDRWYFRYWYCIRRKGCQQIPSSCIQSENLVRNADGTFSCNRYLNPTSIRMLWPHWRNIRIRDWYRYSLGGYLKRAYTGMWHKRGWYWNRDGYTGQPRYRFRQQSWRWNRIGQSGGGSALFLTGHSFAIVVWWLVPDCNDSPIVHETSDPFYRFLGGLSWYFSKAEWNNVPIKNIYFVFMLFGFISDSRKTVTSFFL